MATYLELIGLTSDVDFTKRVQVAVFIAADKIWAESDTTPFHAERLVWAKKVLTGSAGTGMSLIMWVVLAQNRQYTTAQILGATDDAIQTAVDGVVNLFAV